MKCLCGVCVCVRNSFKQKRSKEGLFIFSKIFVWQFVECRDLVWDFSDTVASKQFYYMSIRSGRYTVKLEL